MKITEALQGFYRRCKAENLSINTIKTYSYLFHRAFRYFNGHGKERIEEIKADDIRQYLISLQDAGYSPHSICDVYRSLSCFFRWLHTENYIADNPMKRVKKPKLPKEYARTFGAGEVRILQGFAVGLTNHVNVEGLRGLGAAQATAQRDVSDVAAVLRHLEDSIRGWNGHRHCRMSLQGGNSVVDDTLAHRRTGGIVENQIGVEGVLVGADGR